MNFYKKLGEIRPNQLITTYGPGSIMDAVNDSLTVLDIEYWDTNNIGKEIRDARLASYMNVRRFFMPKTGGKEDIPVVSFPYYHVCSKGTCKFLFDMRDYFDMDQYKKNQGEVKCPKCGFPAYPSRFITVCEDGHMDDFPWRWWVHHGETSCKEDMYLKSMGNTSSLAELRVECNCGARRVMSGAMQKEKFAGLCCSGNHPHRPGAKAKICKKSVIPSQRGASNVYFTVTRNAISICMKMYSSKKIEHAELVLTAPDSFRVKTLRTKDTMRNMIENTEKSLTITGYSISDYFAEMLDVIIKKSQQGVYVRIYVNDIEKQKEALDRLMSYRSRFLQIYEYQKQEDDKMAALHAKLIVSDVKKSLVSSANLSYHGMQGNIEMGFLIESHDKAKQIEEVMKEMVRMKVCGKYK